MPEIRVEQIFNWSPERGFWFTHEPREYETYAEEVERIVRERAGTSGEDDPILHDRGECATCDALRRLDGQEP